MTTTGQTPDGKKRQVDLNWVAQQAATWPTPTSLAHAKGRNNEAGNSAGLVAIREHALAATWSTPRSSDGEKGGPNMAFGAGGTPLPAQAAQATWPTATSSDSRMSGSMGYGGQQFMTLTDAANVSTWATPTTKDHRSDRSRQTDEELYGTKGRPLARQVLEPQGTEPTGATTSGSSEPMAKRGALNPEFVCWLMGYPPEWVSCAPLAMPSSRRSPRK